VIHAFLENVESDIGVDGRVEENGANYVGSWLSTQDAPLPWIGEGLHMNVMRICSSTQACILWVEVSNKRVCHVQVEVLGNRHFCMSGGWSSQTTEHGRPNPSFPCRSWARRVGHATFPCQQFT
jgi:hypothetical protein